ncbi:biotin/lipoyl-containing protein [Shigella flexneri]
MTEIMVKVGDIVEADQSLITVEGDKASMEVPAPFAGTVEEIKVNVGDKVSTGSLIWSSKSRVKQARQLRPLRKRSGSGPCTSGWRERS